MSSSALTKEKLAELVKCVLCMKTFTSPQTMKCLHTFCKHCLENHAKRSSVDDVQGLECPRCKHFTAQNDVTACTRTEQLLALYERGTKRKMCFQCELESAEWKCQDCDQFFCARCKSEHDGFRMFQDHRSVSIVDVDDTLMLDQTVLCASHDTEELKYFCFDCDVLLCSLCLLQGHDGHKRDTVQNAVDHVISKVDEKLVDVKQIMNERFLRAEKLKDTRLLIQTYADESFDAIKSGFEFLKQKLNEDYQTLTQELKTSVDAELEKVNAAIAAEDAKQSHAAAVTSYVENTLATTAGARNVQESIEQMIPMMTQFCGEHLEPLVTSEIHRVKTVQSPRHCKNLLGEVETLSADFHSRYQPLMTKAKFENATVGNTIDIDFGRDVSGYRMNVGFGKIVVCFLHVCVLYNTDGTQCQELDLSGKLTALKSAVFVSSTALAVVSDSGLAIVNTMSSEVKHISKNRYRDVFYRDKTIYGLNLDKGIEIFELNHDEWESRRLELGDVIVNSSATIVVTPSSLYFCNQDSKVLQFSLSGELLQTVTVDEHEPANTGWRICAVDADGRMLLVVGGQLVLQHDDQSQVVKLDEMTFCSDFVFEDNHTFWVFESVSGDLRHRRLRKYTM